MEIRTPITPKEWDAYYDLRYRLLREPLGKPIGSERNDGDLTGRHLALYDNGLKAIARLDKAESGDAQVRFVAVEKDQQGKGYGKMIMLKAEELARGSGKSKMILHARDYAVDFYLSLGYKVVEKSHLLFGVLQHYLMEKVL